MASLTHVCMWHENGWQRITAEKAAHLHPGGTVSAHSGLFMCELCGQYVTLVDGTRQARHFRHSAFEKSKDCPERISGPNVSYGYEASAHELPIRIRNISGSSFELELGFIPVPVELLSEELKIVIKPDYNSSHLFVYTAERLNINGITYLSIGNTPGGRYSIEITGSPDQIRKFWPKTIQGIDSEGTLFDGSTGKKLVNDADVTVGKNYYLLTTSLIYSRYKAHVDCNEICRKAVSWGTTWHLYEIKANDYNEDSARFFLSYHCRLTENPIAIQPIWPVYAENPYVIKYNRDSVIIHLTGDAPTTNVFPYAHIEKYRCGTGSVIEVNCNSRQQLISAGRTKALQYTYFWKEPLNQSTEKPSASVTDLHNISFEGGERNILPEHRTLLITIPYDGLLVVKQDEVLVEKRKISANTLLEADNINWNTELTVYVGLDMIWTATFSRKKTAGSSVDEAAILHRLQSYTGQQIAISHTIGSLGNRLAGYPMLRQWLYKCIRAGHMNERAYSDLQTLLRSGTLNNNEG